MSRTVAFVGLGRMGGPMAANLVRAGHRVLGFDLVPELLATAAATGVEPAVSAAAAAAEADVVITMLPAGAHVLALYGEGGLLAAARPGTLFVDCSTIDVADARAAHEAAGAAGHHSLDAPVSGGVVGARAASLTFMAGGGAEEFAAAGPLLGAMGRKAVHCGTAGAGQAAKICNNMILAVSMIGVSEAFVLAESLGLDHQALYDVASTASGQCWALTVNCPVPGPVPDSPANRDYLPGFAAPLMAKDLALAANALRAGGVAAPLGLKAAELYADFAAGEGAGLDFSAIVHTLRPRNGTPA
ncbi:3-hydroxyisobutyrate dehydrogenase [Streptomyces nojiriensis]|uniref:3-hydroxyisobutyrate dehydrogenase n=1 Tax=Streptomyces nojiriensis TaxID=66374 RepID=A0ABQ3SJ43_9ACTN|nr:3-hydroxyisobutyrate dehydrogenase [Streptomyces nojiriensis]QTI49781.1 putative 3-hydroxyisobutyrate dehydrogenase [Streptomyces nojiriensis]GGS20214.1 3-hydroxyisobutyrate dehydrogenase [Streptomyces nojiriensis]GHI68174.1 3-hydroxyisobutyrate dehydrogenase [Streptomyces nojiriensis]